MKKGALFLILIIFAIGVGFWIQKVYQPPRQNIPDPLIIGTSADYKPLSFREDDTIKGFDIDLITEIAQRLGVSYRIEDQPFEFLIYQLQNSTLHVVAAGLSYTEKRAEQVNFSHPYIIEDPLIVVANAQQADTIQSLPDLYNKTVVVNQGYTAESYMQYFDTINLLRLPNVSEAILALQTGKADAFVTASHTLRPVIAQYGYDAFTMFPIHETTESISLAISPAYSKLRDEINRILQELQQEGIIRQLQEKWQIA